MTWTSDSGDQVPDLKFGHIDLGCPEELFNNQRDHDLHRHSARTESEEKALLVGESGLFLTLGSGTSSARNEKTTSQ